MPDSKRVGYCWSERKGQKINVEELAENFAQNGYEFVKIDLDKDLEQQGPFDAIIHKLSDLLYQIDTDEQARHQIKAFENFIEAHPEIIVIDQLKNVSKILDRYHQYKIIKESDLAKEDGVFTPTFVEMTSTNVDENLHKLEAANVKFPFVCKPLRAQGTRFAHKMSIIFDENSLQSINPPCVAQTFINHNARLYKLFIIKDKYFVIERPSIKNFKPDKHYETVHFDSHDISKPYSSSSLIELDEDERSNPIIEPEKERLDRIVKVMFEELGLYLLGIDVIIENETGRYAIIDMNTFPGYDGVDNFPGQFCRILVDEIKQARMAYYQANSSAKDHHQQQVHSNNNGIYTNIDFDSGIDTSDSCDEKKNPPRSNRLDQNPPTKFYKKQRWHQQQQLNSMAENNPINNNNNSQ
ncbi:inositol-tetrakisphosphate 1-kinase [Dermatophagoides farinae]|uniref:Inositol-tetrakisphosphate 1-kinase n=1 Tax=Dermatophagoides farinae TaxID=6954 RepID=A0A922I420_DERFA|nr:inositol-tetrakisphosphate 1-kinase-like isoform X2 [Dermatophagoides farinae]KAH7641771.1 inositol-tetrakisphosphate 1-kinase-like protein [Dermatophagoides farinae]KAH9518237.1 Inositol-tetrakisphosphate 1-kinase [Dermatophagoides farinae]